MKLLSKHSRDFAAYFRELMKHPANRRAYYASHAWQMRKQAVGLRSKGICERCGSGKFEIAHHLTYAHFGAEYLNELQGICYPCHDYLHGYADYDPCNDTSRPKQGVLSFD